MELNLNKADLNQVIRVYEGLVSRISGAMKDREDKLLNADIYSNFADNMCCGCISNFEYEEGSAFTLLDQTKKGYELRGVITVKSERRHGVGRGIQLYLSDLCRKKGIIPVLI